MEPEETSESIPSDNISAHYFVPSADVEICSVCNLSVSHEAHEGDEFAAELAFRYNP